MTGAAFSPVTNPHDLVLGIAVACAALLWLGMIGAILVLSHREHEQRARPTFRERAQRAGRARGER